MTVTNKPCGVETCDRTVWGNGYCQTHAYRLKKTGDVQAHIPIRPRKDFVHRTCSVEGCEGTYSSLGFCKTHHKYYHQEQKRIASRIKFLEDRGYTVTKNVD